MSFDKNGNYDYEAAAIEKELRKGSLLSGDVRAGLARFGRGAGCVVLCVALFAGLIAIRLGVEYARGRAIGAGVRDAVQPAR